MQRTSNGKQITRTRSSSSTSPSVTPPTGPRRTFSGGMPPPPPSLHSPRRTSSGSTVANMQAPRRTASGSQQTQLAQSMAKSMTIDEMRNLHQRALRDAEAKRTELRLVLASRYRELVGSSDEVIKMKERAQELHDLVQHLPQLMEKLTLGIYEESKEKEEGSDPHSGAEASVLQLRRDLAMFPRVLHRALDSKDVYKATVSLIQLFTLIASQTNAYPMANSLSSGPVSDGSTDLDPALEAQMRMLFLQVQTLPNKLQRMSNGVLARAASYGTSVANPSLGAEKSAAGLVALELLDTTTKDRSERLLKIYFESKAKLLVSLLNELKSDDTPTDTAEAILSKIVLILQYDIIVHPYQIFVIRKLPGNNANDDILQALPLFEKEAVKAKCSKFLAVHLPMIRTKVKSVLVTIAGTTASALGQIRQSLYDKTDGAAAMELLNNSGVCTWDEAVFFTMVDIRTVFNSADAEATQHQRFSLWGALFSNTFSSLVHSLLTTAFSSVHTSVVSTLRDSLTNTPPLNAILPHEAYRNTLKIATDLDQSLLKVSQDAHELLVHAEERVESERRLRQSLYVQTCEIMGRLLGELRRMASTADDEKTNGTKELIIGRLCFLLKFRLGSLQALLSPDSSPASMHSTGGMISQVDLQSAFELADDDEDGLVGFDEAVQVSESAFSGTPFNGAEMVRDTLVLSTGSSEMASGSITLSELSLLTARGLRHDNTGSHSALGTVQQSLDAIVESCFQNWAKSALSGPDGYLNGRIRDFVLSASSVSEEEWKRLFSTATGVSPHIVGFLLDTSFCLNRSTCPSDTLQPVPSLEYATALGIAANAPVASPADTMRLAILSESFNVTSSLLHKAVTSEAGSKLEGGCSSALIQLYIDATFLKSCFVEKNQSGSGTSMPSTERLEAVIGYTEQLLRKVCDRDTLNMLPNLTAEHHDRVFESSDLFMASLFSPSTNTSVTAGGEVAGSVTGTEPMFHIPLASSRRFALLPVKADRSLSDIQLRGKYAKEKKDTMDRSETSSGNVISGGFGFLSSMLKTKK